MVKSQIKIEGYKPKFYKLKDGRYIFVEDEGSEYKKTGYDLDIKVYDYKTDSVANIGRLKIKRRLNRKETVLTKNDFFVVYGQGNPFMRNSTKDLMFEIYDPYTDTLKKYNPTNINPGFKMSYARSIYHLETLDNGKLLFEFSTEITNERNSYALFSVERMGSKQ